MVADAKSSLRHGKDARFQVQLDLRYVGQEFTLSVPVELAQLKRGDRAGHPHGVRPALRAALRAPFAGRAGGDGQHPASAPSASGRSWRFPTLGAGGSAEPAAERAAYFRSAKKPLTAKVYRREALGAGATVAGPALIQEHGTTTVLFEHDTLRVADSGELIIKVGAAG